VAEDPRLFSPQNLMLSENSKQRLGYIDLSVAGDLFRLTAEQREQMVSLVTADPRLCGLRSDGSLPVAVAVKLARAAKGAKC
jgi:hypothetical protein